MSRNRNTTVSGAPFSPSVIEAVWCKGQTVTGYDPNDYRKDTCGAWIKKSSFGTTGNYGWEVDHVRPVAKGGTDDPSNLQPLQWKNNRGKSDDYPDWSCTIQ